MGSQISNVSQVWPGMVSIPHSPIATRGHSSGHTDGIVTEDRPVEPSGARGLQWVNPTGLHPWSHWGASASRTSRIQMQQCSGTCWSRFLWLFFWSFFYLILIFFVSFEKCSVKIASMRVIQSHLFHGSHRPRGRLHGCPVKDTSAAEIFLRRIDSVWGTRIPISAVVLGESWRWCACGVKWK